MSVHCITSVLFIGNLWIISDATWSSPTSNPIRSDYAFAVGAYNDSIFLLGGYYNRKQITEYRTNTDTFIDIGANVLTNDVYGYGQFWSQNVENVFMIHSSGTSLDTFNMITQQYTENWKNIDISVRQYSCLATTNHYLFVVGGLFSDILQVMDFVSYQWMGGVPSMNDPRTQPACIAYYNALWVFGGYNSDSTLQSNERIDITNIASNVWNYIDPITVGASGLRATAFDDNIFIIGGYTASVSLDIVHIVDVTTGAMTVSSDTLVYPVSFEGIALIHNIIYVFGGQSNGVINTWMKYTLETTLDVTASAIPTIIPSKYPTQPTTINPTINPTTNPTLDPTQHPTTNPSYTPSTIPSESPPDTLSDYSTINPSYGESTFSYSTKTPTFDPTKPPTELTVNTPSYTLSTISSTQTTIYDEELTLDDNTLLIVCVSGASMVCVVVVVCVRICFWLNSKRKQGIQQTVSMAQQFDQQTLATGAPSIEGNKTNKANSDSEHDDIVDDVNYQFETKRKHQLDDDVLIGDDEFIVDGDSEDDMKTEGNIQRRGTNEWDEGHNAEQTNGENVKGN